MVEIKEIYAREILNPLGNPTLEVEVELVDGAKGTATVPFNHDLPNNEDIVLLDKNPKRYNGRGMKSAAECVNSTIANELIGVNAYDQFLVDQTMLDLDETEDKSMLGVNSMIGVSLANARAAAKSQNLPLHKYLGGIQAKFIPTPIFTVFNGGCNANNNLDYKEIMILSAGFENFEKAIEAAYTVVETLKIRLDKLGLDTKLTPNGAFAPQLTSTEAAYELIKTSVKDSGYIWGEQIILGINCDANNLYSKTNKKYELKGINLALSPAELLKHHQNLLKTYPITFVENPFITDDTKSWNKLTTSSNASTAINAAELLTHINANKTDTADIPILNIADVGLLSHTLNIHNKLKNQGYNTIFGVHENETDDTFIADLSVALECKYLKLGGIYSQGCIAKCNQLLRIEDDVLRCYAKY